MVAKSYSLTSKIWVHVTVLQDLGLKGYLTNIHLVLFLFQGNTSWIVSPSTSLRILLYHCFLPLFYIFLTFLSYRFLLMTCSNLCHLEKHHSQNYSQSHPLPGTSLSFILTIIVSSWWVFFYTCCLFLPKSHLPLNTGNLDSPGTCPSHQDSHCPIQ